MSGKAGETNVTDARTTEMATVAQAHDCVEVRLVDEAAATVKQISESTGVPVEQLLETSITLLKVLAESQNVGRRMVITTKFLWPVREVTFPKP